MFFEDFIKYFNKVNIIQIIILSGLINVTVEKLLVLQYELSFILIRKVILKHEYEVISILNYYEIIFMHVILLGC